MTTEFEHEGVIYHEPLPRVVLVNFPVKTREELAARGYNCAACEILGPPAQFSLRLPKPANEVDVMIVRDSNAPVDASASPTPYLFSNYHIKVENLGAAKEWGVYCREILERAGICVFFVGSPRCNLYHFSSPIIGVRDDIVLRPTGSAFRIVGSRSCKALTAFVERWRNAATTMAGFRRFQAQHFEPLIEDASGNPLAFLLRYQNVSGRNGLLLCLPDYGHNIDIMDTLLSDVLPELAAYLFPFRRDFSWLKDSEFLSIGIKDLETEKEVLRQGASRQIAVLDTRICDIQNDEQFLIELLTSDGEKLKLATKKVVEVLLASAGIVRSVLDVDSDPALRGGATSKREDLRVELVDQTILINVTGREQALKQTSLNQLSSHHRLFLASAKPEPDKVHSLLIANHNYGNGLDPRRRGKLFGSTTTDAEERLTAEGHGAISTYDLFRLFRAVQAKEITLSPGRLTQLFATVGIFDYESFIKSA
jgi:hypothetical protein